MTANHGTTAIGDEQRENQSDETLPGTPTEAFGCGATGCVSNDRLRRVSDGGRRRVLCAQCARRFAEGGEA